MGSPDKCPHPCGHLSVWGQQTPYVDVDCEPCDPCGNCNASRSIEGEDEASSCILKAKLEEIDRTEECGSV